MIIDTSAIVAILRGESERLRFLETIDRTPRSYMAAPSLLELTMVMVGGHRSEMQDEIDTFLSTSGIQILSFTPDHAAVAREAFLRYGKGRHPAGLNFGDCIAYATARLEAMPLLFKGDDFRLTDIEPAV